MIEDVRPSEGPFVLSVCVSVDLNKQGKASVTKRNKKEERGQK